MLKFAFNRCVCTIGVTLVLMFSSALAFADAGAVDSGSCGDNLSWEITGSAEAGYTLTISGEGKMDSYSPSSGVATFASSGTSPWYEYCSAITAVEIKEGATSVGSYAFCDCTALTHLAIPNSVTSLSSYICQGCTNLESLSIGSGVASLGSYLFLDCVSLAEIEVSPENAYLYVDNGSLIDTDEHTIWAFTVARGDVVYVIPDEVERVKMHVFDNCSSLRFLILGENTQRLNIEAVCNCENLEAVYLPASLERLATNCFANCNALNTFYYAGTEEQWAQVTNWMDSTVSERASIVYNASREEVIKEINSTLGLGEEESGSTPEEVSKEIDSALDLREEESDATSEGVEQDNLPAATSGSGLASQTIAVSSKKVTLKSRKARTIKVTASTGLKVKLSKKAKKSIKVKIVRGGIRLVAKKVAKAGNYKIVVWAKKTSAYKASAKKRIKVKVA